MKLLGISESPELVLDISERIAQKGLQSIAKRIATTS
jgi:hypothetical protein